MVPPENHGFLQSGHQKLGISVDLLWNKRKYF